MLVLVDLFKFKVVITSELGVASSHRVGGFQQVVAEITVARFNHPRMLGLKVTGLVLMPDKASKLGDRSLRIKAVYITKLSNDTGRVDPANARDRCQGIWDDLKLLINSLRAPNKT